MFIIKKKICNRIYCRNWEVVADVEDLKTALYIIQERAKRITNSHLRHIYGIFEGDSISPIKKVEV